MSVPGDQPDRGSSGCSRWRLVALLAACCAVVLWTAGGPLLAVSGLDGEPRYSDFPHFYNAGVATRLGENIYATAPQQAELNRGGLDRPRYVEGGGGYIYPPLLAPLFAALSLLPIGVAAAAWVVLSAVLLVATVWLVGRAALERFGAPTDACAVAFTAAVPLVLMADKIKKTLNFVQTEMVVLFPIAGAAVLLPSRPFVAGVAVAFAAHVKYTALIFVPLLLLRARWRALGGFGAGLIGFALLPALVYGWSRNLEYLGVAFGGLARMVGVDVPGERGAQIHPITWEFSVSVPSAAARLGESVGVGTGLFAPIAAGVGLAGLGLVWWMYRARGAEFWWRPNPGPGSASSLGHRERALLLIEWAALVVVAACFSPQSTTRHFVALLIPVGVAAALIVRGRVGLGPRMGWLLAGLAVVFAGLHLPPGGSGFEAALDGWRWVGGASWAALGFALALVWTGLGVASGPDHPKGTRA